MKNVQKNIHVTGNENKIIGGDYYANSGSKLSLLFEKLKEQFEENDTISKTSDDLKRYIDKRDTIGLRQKLINANKEHLFDEFSWLKQEFHKKLVFYQNYAPAQEIFAFILAIVLERYRNLIKPMIREGSSEKEVLLILSKDIVSPIVNLIQEQGCDDIMGISATEIEGMFHFLTGNCHIKWEA